MNRIASYITLFTYIKYCDKALTVCVNCLYHWIHQSKVTTRCTNCWAIWICILVQNFGKTPSYFCWPSFYNKQPSFPLTFLMSNRKEFPLYCPIVKPWWHHIVLSKPITSDNFKCSAIVKYTGSITCNLAFRLSLDPSILPMSFTITCHSIFHYNSIDVASIPALWTCSTHWYNRDPFHTEPNLRNHGQKMT